MYKPKTIISWPMWSTILEKNSLKLGQTYKKQRSYQKVDSQRSPLLLFNYSKKGVTEKASQSPDNLANEILIT